MNLLGEQLLMEQIPKANLIEGRQPKIGSRQPGILPLGIAHCLQVFSHLFYLVKDMFFLFLIKCRRMCVHVWAGYVHEFINYFSLRQSSTLETPWIS